MIAFIRVCPLFWCSFYTGNVASCAIVQLISWCLIVCRYNSHAGLIRDSVMKVMSEDKVQCQLNLGHWLFDWLDSVLCRICKNISKWNIMCRNKPPPLSNLKKKVFMSKAKLLSEKACKKLTSSVSLLPVGPDPWPWRSGHDLGGCPGHYWGH